MPRSARSARGFRPRVEGWDLWAPTQKAGDAKGTQFSTILATTTNATTVTGNVSVPVLSGLAFQLNSFSGYSNWTSVFDSYRFDRVEVTFRLREAGSSNAFPYLTVYPDFDDANAPPTLAAVHAHPRAKTWTLTPTDPMAVVVVQPLPAVAAYSGVFTSYGQPKGPIFIDSASPAVQHYGVKFGLENFTDTTQNIDVMFRAWITFREPL